MNGLSSAQRSYDAQQSPDYYDTRSDLEIEIDAAIRNKKRHPVVERSAEDEAKWARLEAKRIIGRY